VTPRTLRQISITTTPEAEEAVSELLDRLFSSRSSIWTNAETGRCVVTTYCVDPKEWNANKREWIGQGLEQIRACGLEIGSGLVATRKIRREDWAHSWKRHFKPISIAARLLIKPSWSRCKARGGQAVVVLDPGLSFGTGQHATTSFCLRELVRHRRARQRQSLLDLGTGSGILAIAAAKLGYTPVEAIDFDPDAVISAKANARRNRIGSRIRLWRQDVTKLKTGRRFDVICANLMHNLLLAERRRILNRLQPGGVLILAGILETQFAQVESAYEAAGLKLIRTRVEKEWQSGAFLRQ
jgi:ribosomal protein L11 methyltransferase